MSMMWLLGVLGIVSSAASNASVADKTAETSRQQTFELEMSPVINRLDSLLHETKEDDPAAVVTFGLAMAKEMVGYALALGDVTDRVAAGIVVGKEVQELETTKLVTAWFWKAEQLIQRVIQAVEIALGRKLEDATKGALPGNLQAAFDNVHDALKLDLEAMTVSSPVATVHVDSGTSSKLLASARDSAKALYAWCSGTAEALQSLQSEASQAEDQEALVLGVILALKTMQQEARSLKEPLRKALDEFHAPDSPPVPSRRLSPRRLLPQFTSSGDIIANGPTVSGDTTGEPVQGVGVCDVTVGAPGRWYELKNADPTDQVALETCGSSYDTKLFVYSGDLSNPATLTCVVGNDDACGFQSKVSFVVEAAKTYWVLVHGFGSASGSFVLSAVSTPGIPPIPPGEISCGGTQTGDTTGQPRPSAPFCVTSVTAAGLWYELKNADPADEVALETCGSSYDTKLSVYSGDSNAPTSLICVTGNDDACGLQSEVSFVVEAAKTYWVLVHGFGSASGSFVLSATCTPPDPLPLPCGTTTGDTSSPPAQVYNFPDCPVPITEPGILYELAPITPAQSVTLTTCNGGTLFDTIISVYSPGLQCYTGNDDTGSSLCSTVTFNIDQANTYTILVHGVSTGQFELTVLCSPNPLECTCRHGTPAEGTNCISGGELCESCDTGFVLTEGTCKPWCVTVDYLDYALLGKRGKSDVRDCWKASVIIDNSLLPKDTIWAWKSPKISGTWALGLVALTAVALVALRRRHRYDAVPESVS